MSEISDYLLEVLLNKQMECMKLREDCENYRLKYLESCAEIDELRKKIPNAVTSICGTGAPIYVFKNKGHDKVEDSLKSPPRKCEFTEKGLYCANPNPLNCPQLNADALKENCSLIKCELAPKCPICFTYYCSIHLSEPYCEIHKKFHCNEYQ